MPNTLMGPISPSPSRGRTLQSRRTPRRTRVHKLPRRGARFLPRSGPTYATEGYNFHTRERDAPSFRLSPSPQADVDTRHNKVPPRSLATGRLHGIRLCAVRAASSPWSELLRAITGHIPFPFSGFKYFSPSFQSSFHLSLTLLFHYRFASNI